MSQVIRTKSVIAVEDLAAEIRNGTLPPGHEFYTMGELMQRYDISVVTASKVLQELRKLGLLDVHKGRRSIVVSNNKPIIPKLEKPIAIINPAEELFASCRWRSTLLQELQKRITADGNQALCLPMDFNLCRIAESCAGLIYSNEFVNPENWQHLLDSGFPCARLSFDYLQVNTVFVDYRSALDQFTIDLLKNDCKRTIYICQTPQVLKTGNAWIARNSRIAHTLRAHGIGSPQNTRLTFLPKSNRGWDDFAAEITKGNGKIAVILRSSDYYTPALQALKRLGKRMHLDYEIYCMSSVEDERLDGHCIDIKYPAAAQAMVSMLYMQIETEKPQIGKALLAEFIPGN